MALYECIFIIRPDISEHNTLPILSRFTEKVQEARGSIVKTDYLGKRRLSHRIKKNEDGHYIVLWVEMEPISMNDLKKEKFTEDIIRMMILRAENIDKTCITE